MHMQTLTQTNVHSAVDVTTQQDTQVAWECDDTVDIQSAKSKQESRKISTEQSDSLMQTKLEENERKDELKHL